MKLSLLSLLLGISAVQAAPLDAVDCRYPAIRDNQVEIDKAERAVAQAEANPGNQLALADALAELAAEKIGQRDAAGAKPLAERAQSIWAAAQPDARLAGKLHQTGRGYYLQSKCLVAKPVLQAAFDMSEKANGADAAQTLAYMHDLLRLAIVLKDAAVDALAPRLLAAWDARGEPAAADALALYHNLALFYFGQQAYDKAESLLKRSIALAAAKAPADPGKLRRLKYDLAVVYYRQLRYAEAEAIVAALTPVTANLPSQYGERKRIKDDMGALVRAGDLAGALGLGEKALPVLEADIEQARFAVAAAEQAQAALDPKAKALEAGARRLAAARDRLRGDIGAMALMLDYVGEVHHGMNRLAQAEDMYLMALQRFSQVPGFNNPGLSHTQMDLAILYRSKGEFERALPLQETAFEALRKRGGADHPDVLESEGELAYLYKATKQYAQAEPLYLRRLERAERANAAPAEVGAALESLADIAVAQGQPGAAEAYLRRAVALWERAGPGATAQLAGAVARLARLTQPPPAGRPVDKAVPLEARPRAAKARK